MGPPSCKYLKAPKLDGAYLGRLLLAVLAVVSSNDTFWPSSRVLKPSPWISRVDEQIVAILTRDETIALVSVEPLNCTFTHLKPSSRPAGQNKTT